jgi:two-component system cell cycle response regulator CtrA
MRLLLVQSNSAADREAWRILAKSGAIIDHVRTVEEAIMYLQAYDYDTIVLDRALEDMDGLEVVRWFRSRGFNTPLLLLLDQCSGQTKAQALRNGADDLLIKPCDKDEFVARIEATVRRWHGHARSLLRVGPLEIDIATREVRIDGQPISVTRKEYSILELMALRKGHVIAKQNFFDHLYSGIDAPETRIIDVFICNLRKKLAVWGIGSLIDTVRGHGYIMRGLAEAPIVSREIADPAGFRNATAVRWGGPHRVLR